MPVRIQRKRTKGWRMPPNTVSVTRPGEWGNPWVIDKGHGGAPFRVQRKGCGVLLACATEQEATAAAVDSYRKLLLHDAPANRALLTRAQAELRGKNLACFCALDQPCHADVLLELANR